jgi:hypothetical protein
MIADGCDSGTVLTGRLPQPSGNRPAAGTRIPQRIRRGK